MKLKSSFLMPRSMGRTRPPMILPQPNGSLIGHIGTEVAGQAPQFNLLHRRPASSRRDAACATKKQWRKVSVTTSSAQTLELLHSPLDKGA
jgi:hypothetical protein